MILSLTALLLPMLAGNETILLPQAWFVKLLLGSWTNNLAVTGTVVNDFNLRLFHVRSSQFDPFVFPPPNASPSALIVSSSSAMFSGAKCQQPSEITLKPKTASISALLGSHPFMHAHTHTQSGWAAADSVNQSFYCCQQTSGYPLGEKRARWEMLSITFN